jgi:hypothetical protein
MLGPGQAVEIAAHRTEAVVRADRPVIKVFDLLQDRIGTPICKHVAGDEQNRQPVHMRHCRGSDHVRSTRTYR